MAGACRMNLSEVVPAEDERAEAEAEAEDEDANNGTVAKRVSAKFTYDFPPHSFSSIKCRTRVRALQRTQFCPESLHVIDNANNGK